MIYVNKIENRTTFKSKIDKDKNGKNVPHLKITTFLYC